jgi:hypothetical protein
VAFRSFGIQPQRNRPISRFCVETLKDALARHGKPEIFNNDQGSQYTGAAFTEPPRVCRRLFVLSYAAMAGSSMTYTDRAVPAPRMDKMAIAESPHRATLGDLCDQ